MDVLAENAARISETSTGSVPFPQSSARSNVREPNLRWQVQPRSAPVHTRDRVPRAQSPSSYSLRAGKLECENDAHVLLMNCAQATHEERRTGAILLRPRWRELAPQRIADRDRCRPIIAIRETKHMHMRVPTYASPNAKTTMRRCSRVVVRTLISTAKA